MTSLAACLKVISSISSSQAGLKLSDLDIFECHDAYAIMAALSLESVGFVKKGEALAFAAGGGIRRDGKVPIATSGGLKARGHPVGASGVYQVVLPAPTIHFNFYFYELW